MRRKKNGLPLSSFEAVNERRRPTYFCFAAVMIALWNYFFGSRSSILRTSGIAVVLVTISWKSLLEVVSPFPALIMTGQSPLLGIGDTMPWKESSDSSSSSNNNITNNSTTKQGNNTMVRLVVISDTHGSHDMLTPMLPEGDILLHCGDFCNRGSKESAVQFVEWFSGLSQYQHKFVIDGNHDRDLDHPDALNIVELFSSLSHKAVGTALGTVRLLQDETVTVPINRGGNGKGPSQLVIHGSSWKSCEADSFGRVPDGVDVWMVHKHPYINEARAILPQEGNINEAVAPLRSYSNRFKGWKGSQQITHTVKHRNIPICLSGHIHWSRGIVQLPPSGGTTNSNRAELTQNHRQMSRSATATQPTLHTFVNAASVFPSSVGIGMSPPVVIDYDVQNKRIIRIQLEPYPTKA